MSTLIDAEMEMVRARWRSQLTRSKSILGRLRRSVPEVSKRANDILISRGDIARLIRARFITGGLSMGFPWLPLRGSTMLQRIRQGFPPVPPLTRSGALREAMASGRMNATSDSITVEMRDGPAPVYRGSAGTGARLSTYAGELDVVRPFSSPPVPGSPEHASLMARRQLQIDAMVASIADGKAL